jgi:hypothetical protein
MVVFFLFRKAGETKGLSLIMLPIYVLRVIAALYITLV